MAVRHNLLAAGGVAVVVAAIYLAIEVRATPAAADAVRAPATRAAADPTPEGLDTATEPSASSEPGERPRGTSIRAGIPTPSKLGRSASPSGTAPEIAASAKLDDKKLQQLVTDAYSAYDRQDFDDAKTHAATVLVQEPKNVRALRIMVSTACIDGNPADAQKYFDQLPEGKDRADMRTRCERDYNITFK